jgi:glutaminyl-tRNA synthetase
MPTLSAMRRRGYPAEGIRRFCEIIGVARMNSKVDFALLEHTLRDTLNRTAPRFMAVLDPVKLIITNDPDDHVERMVGVNNPEDPSAGTREIPFSKELWIEREDFRAEAPSKYFRLVPDGREVRLRYGYVVKATGFKAAEDGTILEVYAEYDPATRGGNTPDGRKVKGTIHWVCKASAAKAEVRLYEHLFASPDPDDVPEGESWLNQVNEASLKVVQAFVEPALSKVSLGTTVQFERSGYFCLDQDTSASELVFNRTVTLRDTWAKVEKRG